MAALSPTRTLLLAVLAAGSLTGYSTPGEGRASAAAPGNGGLRKAEASALLELYAAESALARAQLAVERLEASSARLATAEEDARRRTAIVRRSLAASQRRIAALLRSLYVQEQPNPIAVILGATSLDEAMAGVDELSRAAAQNRRLAAEATRRATTLARLEIDLSARRRTLDEARAAARRGVSGLADAASAKRATVATIRRTRALAADRLAALDDTAQEAVRRSATMAPPADDQSKNPAPATPASGGVAASPAPTRDGTRTLVVDAVAYHLPGRTASGLPVGPGVVAVDPSVIPLGTRMLVPGYGPAVAADVGTAIKGNIIDLWYPTTAQARAWGRRTVTITVYG